MQKNWLLGSTRMRIGRACFHCLVAVFLSPLPMSVVVARRALGSGARRPAWQAFTAASVGTVAGCVWSFWAPTHAVLALVGCLGIWLLAAVSVAHIEALAGLVPESNAPTHGAADYAVAWGVGTWISFSVWGVFLAAMTSRWGFDLAFKPSLFSKALLVGLLVLIPLGAVLGLSLRAWGNPLRPSGPINLTLAAAASLFLSMASFVLINWSAGELLGPWADFEELSDFSVVCTLWLLVPWPLSFLLLLPADGIQDFLFRCLLASACLLLSYPVFMIWSGSLPLAWVDARAEAAAARGAHRSAVDLERWLQRREYFATDSERRALRGVREAFLAGDGAAAAALLEAAVLLDDSTIGVRLEEALLGTGGSLGAVQTVEIEPVSMSGLDGRWAALLTALRTLEPGLRESEVRARLRTLSQDYLRVELPWRNWILSAKAAASLFGARLVEVESVHLGPLLEAGVPVLLPNSAYGMTLAYWRSTSTGALIVVDYALWRDSKKELVEERARRDLVEPDEGSGKGLRLARLSRVDSEARLFETNPEGGLLAFLPLGAADSMEASLGIDPLALTRRLRRQRAGEASLEGDLGRAASLARELPRSERREVLALAALHPKSQDLGQPELWSQAVGALEELQSPEGLREISEGFLHQAWSLLPRSSNENCAWKETLENERARRFVGNTVAQRALAERAARQGDWATLLARLPLWLETTETGEGSLLAAMRMTTTIPGAHEQPELRELLQEWLGDLAWWFDSDTFTFRPRRSLAPYCAAKAVLADSALDRWRWWRRAARLEPRNGAMWARLAEASEEAGKVEVGEHARRMSLSVTGMPACGPERRAGEPEGWPREEQ